jgi:hypothetical protein
MKTSSHSAAYPLLAAVFTLCGAMHAAAQTPVFFADFDGGGKPALADDPAFYDSENAAMTWDIGPFAANGTDALKMTGGGCGSSGFAPLPGVEDWSDGVIQLDMGRTFASGSRWQTFLVMSGHGKNRNQLGRLRGIPAVDVRQLHV